MTLPGIVVYCVIAMGSRKYTIVAVDDDLFLLKVLQRLLKDEHYSLFTSTDVNECLSFIRKNKVDMIISDYHMPAKNGFEFLHEAGLINKSAIKMLVTGTPDASLEVETLSRLGIYKIILKPWDNDSFKQIVREALESRSDPA